MAFLAVDAEYTEPSMFELNKDQYGKVWPLFKDVPHSRSFVSSAFEDNHIAHLYVDVPAQPTVALLDLACEFTFVNGSTTNVAFNANLRELLQSRLQAGKYVLLFTFAESWRILLQEMVQGYKVLHIARSVYSITPERFAPHAGWRMCIPAGYTVRRYDPALTASAQGIADFWG